MVQTFLRKIHDILAGIMNLIAFSMITLVLSRLCFMSMMWYLAWMATRWV